MEWLFLTLRMPERDRVTMVVPLLNNVAHRWWKAELERRARTTLPMLTWEEFKELFFATYFSDSAKQQMEEDFKESLSGELLGAGIRVRVLPHCQLSSHRREE